MSSTSLVFIMVHTRRSMAALCAFSAFSRSLLKAFSSGFCGRPPAGAGAEAVAVSAAIVSVGCSSERSQGKQGPSRGYGNILLQVNKKKRKGLKKSSDRRRTKLVDRRGKKEASGQLGLKKSGECATLVWALPPLRGTTGPLFPFPIGSQGSFGEEWRLGS